MWEHLVLMICEIATAHRKIHDTNWRDHISLPNRREFVRLLLQSRPVAFVTGHLGNFEIAGYIAGLLGFPTFTIARKLDNPFLDRFLGQYRGATGQFILPTRGSSYDAQRILKAGESLALLGDHYAGPKGCWVEFFGRPASCHKAVALFSLSGDAPMVVTYAKRKGGLLKFELGMSEVVDPRDPANQLKTVPELTRWYNQCLERMIRESPDQYWWLHRRWKDPRKNGKKLVKNMIHADTPGRVSNEGSHRELAVSDHQHHLF